MGQLVFQATLGGQVNLVGPNTASTFNLDVPAVTSTLATTSGTETLTNKTLTAPTLASANITTALTLTGAAGTSGQVLTSAGTGAAPTWTTASASQWTTSGSNIYYTTGNVGINTSSTPDAFLQVYAAAGKVATFGNNVNNSGNYIVLGGTVSNKNWVLANNVIVGGEFGIGRTSATGGTTIGSAYDLMIDFNGGVKVANTLGVGYTTPSTSGAGITFPATQSASSDANTLDDYEEGTWTPVLGTSNGGTATMSVQEGWYVKIGKFVQFSAQVIWTAKNTWDFNTRISGLPFAARSNTGSYGWPNACQMQSNLTTTPFVYSIEANSTQGYVNPIYALTALGQSDFPASGRVLINGCYQIA